MNALGRGLMLRAQDTRGRPTDVELFRKSDDSAFSMLFTLVPDTLAYWPVFRSTSDPADRMYDRASKRLLYGQAAIYRNIVGRVSLGCAREWQTQYKKGLLRLCVSDDGWLVAAVQRLDDDKLQPPSTRIAPLYAQAA